ncbi:MAG TPA: hypothetical protein VII58_00905 [Acidobacteriaceae bacterium]
MTDLRNHLFEVMEALKDEDKPMDIERAKAVIGVAQVLVDTAKVEVQFLNAIDSSEATEFFDMQRIEKRRSLATGDRPEPTFRRIAG